MTTKYGSTLWAAALLVASMCLFPSHARADWIEEFTGGTFDNAGWFFADELGNIPPDASTVAIHPQNEFLEIFDTTPDANFDLAVSGLLPTQSFTNVAATATVAGPRGLAGNNDMFLAVRSDGASGYLLNLDFANGAAELVKVTGGAPSLFSNPGSTASIEAFDPFASYTLQLSALGSMLFGQVRDSDGKVRAVVSANDGTYTGGWTGIGASINDNPPSPPPSTIYAGFDNIASVAVSAGASPTDPILPSTGSSPWGFTNVPGNGKWFDPFPATGYIFETDGLSNFTAVMLPVGYDDDNMFTIDDGGGPVAVAGGTLHVFSPAVSSFVVGGIYVPVDGDDPLAFPTFVAFDELMVSFTQTPVPEPSSFALAGLVAVGLAFRARRRAGK